MKLDYTREELLKLSKEELIDDILLPLLEFVKQYIKPVPPKTSKNSSKPPSTDIKGKLQKKKKKKGGAKKGHKAHYRKISNNPDRQVILPIDECPNCGITTHNFNSNTFDIHQILELKSLDFEIIEFLRQKSTCSIGNTSVTAPNPPGIFDNDFFGPRLKSLILILYYEYHLSYNKIRHFIMVFSNTNVSKGAIINVIKRCGKIFKKDYEQIKEYLRNGDVVLIDETGWRVDGENWWMWVFNNEKYTFYTIEKSRGSNVVREILGEIFNGGIVSDFYSSYSENKVISKWKQKCLAHLIRFLIYIYELTGTDEGSFAGMLLKLFREAIHLKNSVDFESEDFKTKRDIINNKLDNILKEDIENKDEKRLKKRLIKYRKDLLLFLYHEKIPATNNASERALRQCVIHRKSCNGNRSIDGKNAYAVNKTIIETLKKQNEKIFENLVEKLSPKYTLEPKIKLLWNFYNTS